MATRGWSGPSEAVQARIASRKSAIASASRPRSSSRLARLFSALATVGMVVAEPAPTSLEDLAEELLGLGEIAWAGAPEEKHSEVVAALQGVEMVFAEDLAPHRQAAALEAFGLLGLGRVGALDEHDRQVVDALGDVGVAPPDRAPRAAPALRGTGSRPPRARPAPEGPWRGCWRSRRHRPDGRRAARGGGRETPPARARARSRRPRLPCSRARRESSAARSSGRSASSRRTAASLRSRNSPSVVVSRSSSSSANGSAPKRSIRKLDSSRALSRSDSRGVAFAGHQGRLPHGEDGERGEQQCDDGRGADADAVPAGELAQPVGRALGPGADRPAGAEAG